MFVKVYKIKFRTEMAPHCYLSCVQPFPFMWFCAFCNSVCYKKFARYRSESVDTAEVVMWWHFCSELEFYIACTDCNHVCEFNDKLQPLSLPVCPLLQMSVRFMIKCETCVYSRSQSQTRYESRRGICFRTIHI